MPASTSCAVLPNGETASGRLPNPAFSRINFVVSAGIAPEFCRRIRLDTAWPRGSVLALSMAARSDAASSISPEFSAAMARFSIIAIAVSGFDKRAEETSIPNLVASSLLGASSESFAAVSSSNVLAYFIPNAPIASAVGFSRKASRSACMASACTRWRSASARRSDASCAARASWAARMPINCSVSCRP